MKAILDLEKIVKERRWNKKRKRKREEETKHPGSTTSRRRKLSITLLLKIAQQFPPNMLRLLKFGPEEDFKLLLKFQPWEKWETTSIMFLLSGILNKSSGKEQAYQSFKDQSVRYLYWGTKTGEDIPRKIERRYWLKREGVQSHKKGRLEEQWWENSLITELDIMFCSHYKRQTR